MSKPRTPVKKAPAAKSVERSPPIADFASRAALRAWLEANHASSPGVWLRLSKKASATPSVSYAEAVEEALCFGWIDGQKDRFDASAWLQKFTPRGPRSVWSKINREKVQALVEGGLMRPAGLAAVEKARANGQWEAAYDAPSTSTVPADFQAALDRSKAAGAFFATLNKANRYAMLWRIQTAKKAETRERRIAAFIEMLEKGEKLHP
jgi:uncharacterized protein YdeI (YjbR/CyaY-like superfamily)